MKPLVCFWKDRRANAATEFVLILPVMLTFMVGIVEFGRLFQAYDGVNRLATRYASAYSDCNDSPSGNCNTELSYYWPSAAINNIVPQLTNGVPSVRMFQVQYSAAGTPIVVYQYPSGASMTPAETQAAALTIYTPGAQQTGVVVSVSYTHAIIFFSQLLHSYVPDIDSHLAVSYTVAQRKT